MDKLSILVDYRERKVFDALSLNSDIKNGSIKYEIKNLNYGDYNIMYDNKVLAIFERKTWKDLSATIKDKQRSENIEKLHFCRNETKCDVYYIIEGNFRFSDTRKIGGIEFHKLEMKLISLMVNNGIYVVQSANESHTIDKIVKFAKYYLKKNKVGSNELPAPPPETPELSNRRIWNNLRGLGKESTEIVSNAFGIGEYIDGLINREELEALKIPKRAINQFLKYSLMENSERILCGILRVSLAIAKAILGKKTIIEVKKSTIEELSMIEVEGVKTRRVGKALAGRIIEILNFKHKSDSKLEEHVEHIQLDESNSNTKKLIL
jgi:ERCC4-type nuclease